MPELSEVFDYLEKSPLAKHAQLLGYLSITWAWLEMGGDALLYKLMYPDDDEDGLKAAGAIMYNMGERDKLRALLALGFLRKPSDDWYSELEKLVNHIDNDLRPERNRMTHDFWFPGVDEIFRMTNYAKVVREQARKLELKFGSAKEMPLSKLYVLVIKVMVASGTMLELISSYSAAQCASPDKSE